ncbi:MAG: DNA polymerase [Opitutales bacterium]
MSLRSLFIDFDAYFASCEQHLQPELRGRSVGVAPVQSPGGSCIAASYEARAHGIKVGTRVAEARERCPGIAIVPSRPELYVKLHHEVKRIIDSCMYVEKVFSIDEMTCPLTGRWRQPDQALKLARQIKARLAAFGPALKASIGLAPNTWLAKVATEMRKPNGLVLLQEADLPHALEGLALKDLPMIAEGMRRRLACQNVHTIRQLYELPIERMRAIWGGIDGERFWGWLHGKEVPPVETRRQHMGHSRVLPPDRRNPAGVRATLFRLLQRAAIRLRAEGYYAGCLNFQIRFYNGHEWADKMTLAHTRETPAFIEALRTLWERVPAVLWGATPQSCSIILCDLEPAANHTPSLFQRAEKRDEALASALDNVTRRFGQKSLYFGCAHGGFDEATAVRIAFNRIPNLTFEN